MIKSAKTMLIALMMLLGIIVPTTLSAQHTDGFFRNSEGVYQDRDGFSFTVNTQNFLGNVDFTVNTQNFEDPDNNSLPLGSGVVILLAAGAGYAALKRKEKQK